MSRSEDYLLSVAHGRRGPVPGALRLGLSALAPVYCVGLKTYLLPYHLGIRKQYRLACPVISIGNLTTGGTGKTPMTQTLCRLLQGEGKRVAILSRGYGGRYERGCAVVSDGQKVRLNAREAGDEAYLLARTLPGVPVVVGKDRRVTGKLAAEQFQPDVILLDDGLQFWQLHRDLDIVLLNACAPFDNGWTFPRGLLREPPSHLRRAGIVVLTNVKRAGPEQTQAVHALTQRLAPGRPIFYADLEPARLRAVSDRSETPLEWLAGRRVGALCAVGNPASFESMIGDLRGVLAARFRFRDHHTITLADLEQAFTASCKARAQAVLTTEKDAVKMAPLQTPLPLLALQVKMQVAGEAEFLGEVLNRMNRIDRMKTRE